MSTGYKIVDQEGLYYLTFQVVGWVDIFTRKAYRDIVIESFRYCRQHKGLNLYAYVIMSNHVHLLAQSRAGDLSGWIRDFKNHTSKKILEVLQNGRESRKEWMEKIFEYHAKLKSGQKYQIWTHENHAEFIYSQNFVEQKLQYIRENPVRSGLVAKPKDYLYSSARNYAEQESLIDVIRLEMKWKTYWNAGTACRDRTAEAQPQPNLEPANHFFSVERHLHRTREGKCIYSGKPSTCRVLFARAY